MLSPLGSEGTPAPTHSSPPYGPEVAPAASPCWCASCWRRPSARFQRQRHLDQLLPCLHLIAPSALMFGGRFLACFGKPYVRGRETTS
jgi:hypothetical protein